ncbi:chaperone protein Dnaj 11 chloroplastic, partial [Phtheirospermum japonicum]
RRSLRVSAGYATAERTGVANHASHTASFYEVLGIRTGATCQEIKSAYRRLARVLHPDVACGGAGGSAADEFMRVHAAYATLSDPEKRAAYDGSILRRPRAAAAVVSTDGGYSDVSRRRRTWETDQCW